jgi:uncharacterized protein (TIRG00374 family)
MHLNDRMKLLLRAGITLSLLAFLLVSVDIGTIISTIKAMDIIPILLCLPITCIMYFIRAEKWRILLRAIDIDIDFPRALKIFLIGTFYGTVTPGRTGEVSRSFYLSDKKSLTISTVVIDRVTDIVCLLALSILMLLAVFHDSTLAVITLIVVAGFIVICAVVLESRLVSFASRILGISDKHRDEYLSAVSMMLRDRWAVPSAFGLTLAYYALNTILFWLVLMAISPTINPLIALSLPLIIIMGNVPISISGLGVRELVSVVVFNTFNESAAYGLSASLTVYLLTTLLPGLVGSVFTLGGERPHGAEKGEL